MVPSVKVKNSVFMSRGKLPKMGRFPTIQCREITAKEVLQAMGCIWYY